jgi:hypothetical protein
LHQLQNGVGVAGNGAGCVVGGHVVPPGSV